MTSGVYDRTNKQDLIELLTISNEVGANIDIDTFVADCFGENKLLTELYDRWIKSVENGKPDFSVYSDDVYMIELFNCWKVCSRKHVRNLKTFVQDHNDMFTGIKRVLDLGCGCAYTTVALSEMFRDANIVGTNVSDTVQYRVAERICEGYTNCVMIPENHTLDLGSVDIVFASEFFEHLTEPLVLLEDLIKAYNPRYVIFANTFTKMSLGHFTLYVDKGNEYSGHTMSRMFYDKLRSFGYTKVPAKFFMDSLMIYRRTTNVLF